MKKFLNENIVGILGTVIFHLILVIVFFSWQLTETTKYQQPEIIIDFSEDVPENREDLPENERVEELHSQPARSNIGVNVADNLPEEISTEKFEQELMEELYKDRPKEATREYLEELKKDIESRTVDNEGNMPSTADEKPASGPKFSGPTNITYNLPGRSHTYLPVPVYLCQGSATVTLDIAVSRYGNVQDARISSRSAAADDCFKQAALDAALKSKFNTKSDAQDPQRGTITYQFVSQ